MVTRDKRRHLGNQHFLLALALLPAGACSNAADVASASKLCRSQEVDTPLELRALPPRVEIWKPNGDQVSVGVLDDGSNRALCTMTLGDNARIVRIDMRGGT